MTILAHAQETLGRGADDGDVRRFEERGKGRGVANPHPPHKSHGDSVSGASKRCDRLV